MGYPDRRPGNVPWNPARFSVARHVRAQPMRRRPTNWKADVRQLATEISKLQGDRTRIAAATGDAAETLDALAGRLASAPVDARTLRYVRAIVDDAERISNGGERSAEQAAMSLETLLGALTQNKEVDAAAARAALDRLFQQLENPSGYDPRKFEPVRRRMTDVLR